MGLYIKELESFKPKLIRKWINPITEYFVWEFRKKQTVIENPYKNRFAEILAENFIID